MEKLVCIDAGHGGSDPGASSSGIHEKNIALSIALKLKQQLLKQHFNIFMTRETDIYDTVLQKAKKANASNSDIFISIHCNSSAAESASGIETLSYSLTGKSFELAKDIQSELIQELKRKDRGVKERKELAVLNSTTMPAVLIETGFISNDEERNLLLDNSFQERMTIAITKGVCKYFNMSYEDDNKRYNNIKEVPDWAKPYIQRLIDMGSFADTNKLDLTYDMIRIFSIIGKRYNTIGEVPDWASPAIQRLINKGCFADTNNLDLSYDMIKTFVIIDREKEKDKEKKEEEKEEKDKE